MEGDVPVRPDVPPGEGFVVQGVVTLAAVLLAFLALDDITTDNAASFVFEYAMLVACGAWCARVAFSLTRTGRRVLGMLSFAVLAAVGWAGMGGFGTRAAGGWGKFWPEYLAALSAVLWFSALSVFLIVLGRRDRPGTHGGPLRGTTPAGKPIVTPGVNVDRVEGGRIV